MRFCKILKKKSFFYKKYEKSSKNVEVWKLAPERKFSVFTKLIQKISCTFVRWYFFSFIFGIQTYTWLLCWQKSFCKTPPLWRLQNEPTYLQAELENLTILIYILSVTFLFEKTHNHYCLHNRHNLEKWPHFSYLRVTGAFKLNPFPRGEPLQSRRFF